MKKILSLTLCLLLILSLAVSCAESDTNDGANELSTDKVEVALSKKMFDALSVSYKKAENFIELASLYHGGVDLSSIDTSFLSSVNTDMLSYSEYLIACHFVKKSGGEIPTGTDNILGDVLSKIKDKELLKTLSTETICKAVIALSLWEKDTSSLFADELIRRQQKDGGFYDNDDKYESSIVTSWVLIAYKSVQKSIGNSEYNTTLFDGSLEFLSDEITDNNSVLEDVNESCTATALALTAFIAAGIPLDGVVSNALLNAVSEFEKDGKYSDTKSGEVNSFTTAAVLLATSSAMYGCPFTEEKTAQ